MISAGRPKALLKADPQWDMPRGLGGAWCRSLQRDAFARLLAVFLYRQHSRGHHRIALLRCLPASSSRSFAPPTAVERGKGHWHHYEILTSLDDRYVRQ